MSYQVLARKWRPKSFPEMVGQEHVLRAMVNALEQGRLHHAYLFTGTRGVGKTTIARILAKSLNCDTGVTANPCGVCSACREIDEGRFVDLIEVDAASRTKVEDTRELLENVQYAPTRGRYKVYLIDEVHMLSGHSFNALLKTLEEPPAHVKFLLATTDPQKLPITILSRCLQFSLKAMTPERIVMHLKKVLTAETVQFEEGALWALGRAAQGSMRDAMSLTDQAIAFGNGAVTEREVRDMLGTIDRDWVWRLLKPLADHDVEAMFNGLKMLAEHSPDYAGVLADIIASLHRVATAQIYPEAVDDSEGDRQKVLDLAAQLSAEDVQLYYQLALNGRRDLPLAPDARVGFEMVVMRMMLFRPMPAAPEGATLGNGERKLPLQRPVANVASAPPPSARAATSGSSTLAGVGMNSNAAASVAASKPAAVAVAVETLTREMPSSVKVATPTLVAGVANVPVAPSPILVSVAAPAVTSTANTRADNSAAPATQTPEPRANPGENVVDLAERRKETDKTAEKPLQAATGDRWSDVLASLNITGPVMNMARNCALEGEFPAADVGDETWVLAMSAKHEFLLQAQRVNVLETALSEGLGRALKLKIEIREPSKETPDMRSARIKRERLEKAEATFVTDPFVKEMIQEFSAVVERHSIRPTDEI